MIAAAVWCLILALYTFKAYAVYQASRWGICLVAIYGAIHRKGFISLALVGLAVLFNPISSFRFHRDTWQEIDFVAAVAFIVSAFQKK